ncbi:hypothetical protein [Antribacter gilvus]|uniref:hypothetical protein n=1 Tax=Antribacter gilvus TaxID=2304675 RepID=UPI000F7B8637|nr:hypothetical protein [Antribacter gilvus]
MDDVLRVLTPENRELLRLRDEGLRRVDRFDYVPWRRPCVVRVLVVADGLDFDPGNGSGLSTFVSVLLDSLTVRFEVTLAHLQSAAGAQMYDSETRIARRISPFAFDKADQFAPDMYDVVFLFGIAERLFSRGTAPNGSSYPTDRLADTELAVIEEFENGGGGLFATGDHGALGKYMGAALPRARDMRLWSSTSGDRATDEVSMRGARRNDTNRNGASPGSQFDDQSDDLPQTIEPRMYSVSSGLFRYRFPHPLLCGPRGVITVMPDHPHEGECKVPANPDLNLASGPEFPPAVDGGSRPLPEVISSNRVLAGTTSGDKDPTVPHTFGGISAYDGHRAGIGRVVTDATWHHFVNVNLTGIPTHLDPVKSRGFLASAAGQEHLADIKAYYRNLATWLSRPANLRCMRSKLLLNTLLSDRVLEAVLTTRHVGIEKLGPQVLWLIGKHAQDAMGQYVSRCQTRRLVIDLVRVRLIRIFPEIDPWEFRPESQRLKGAQFAEEPAETIRWADADHLLTVALGAALVRLSEKVGDDPGELNEKELDEILESGANEGLDAALGDLREVLADLAQRVEQL